MTTITWTQFGTSAAVLLVSYYLIFAFYCYRQKLKEFLSYKGAAGPLPYLPQPGMISGEEYPHPEEDQEETTDELPVPESPAERMDELIQLVEEHLSDYHHENQDREELLGNIKESLARYPEFPNSDYRPALDELISSMCEESGAREISQSDIEEL